MKKSELIRLLKSKDFTKTRESGPHEIWHKEGFKIIPVPKNAGEISSGTLAKILKLAGIDRK